MNKNKCDMAQDYETELKLITAKEAISIFEFATVADIYAARELFDAYRAYKGKDENPQWDTMRILSFIYGSGRIEGIREERARRNGSQYKNKQLT